MLACKRAVLMLMVQHSRFSLSAAVYASKNHYDSLGITPKATQSDIKAAYYKLSMMYHPDKNKGSDVASEKFRAISEAYEVLGNFKLRKLYDKGILHTAGPQYADAATVVDDDQTRFYKSRTRRHTAPTPTGRTPIYDFDEWSRAHYGDAFARRAAAKEKFERKVMRERTNVYDIEKELVVFGILSFIMVYVLFNYAAQSHDVVLQQDTNRQDEVNDKKEPVKVKT
ncbi:dnaJ homolog subfamily C member 30, mitochondrial [Anabrus simplex]|uniref:dnaJ homolog subfamily C member 30, mitochondrial n=1 Tax=Anabrus simplex TaxID=316456 RepID=UPI0034DD256E